MSSPFIGLSLGIIISCALLALPGCAPSADDDELPTGYHFKPMTPQGKSAITALRKRLDSRYIKLGPSRFGRESDYEYLFVSTVTWESFGWEAMYHTKVIFFRSKGERDWSNAVVYYGISHAPDSNVLAFAKASGHLLPLKKTEHSGSGLPATRSKSDSEGGVKPQHESEGHSR